LRQAEQDVLPQTEQSIGHATHTPDEANFPSGQVAVQDEPSSNVPEGQLKQEDDKPSRQLKQDPEHCLHWREVKSL
jgi:hypothetical protein